MQPDQFILPTVATLALGTALLVPLRDDRLGKRATLGGRNAPLKADFRVADALPETPVVSEPNETESEPQQPARAEILVALSDIGIRVRRFFENASAKTDLEQPANPADSESSGDIVIERSFADTLDALLPSIEESSDAQPSEPRSSRSTIEPAVLPVHVVASTHQTFDRVVPLTRMPLRPVAAELSWPSLCASPVALESKAQRHAFLTDPNLTGDPKNARALFAAYREEDPQGRLLAMLALRKAAPAGVAEIFNDALHVGTDEERSLAVDALFELGRRDDVTAAFTDRVDAIAAQASLGYVGTYRRDDYLRELEPFVDRSRIESILTLLAGIVE